MEAGDKQVVSEQPALSPVLDKFGRAWGVGRRKNSVARVIVQKGSGKIIVNGRESDAYFSVLRHKQDLQAPLALLDILLSYDIRCRVNGGGHTGQSGAIRLSIARALVNLNPLYRKTLRQYGFLTCDSRRVESKKYGRKKARKRFQFAKR